MDICQKLIYSSNLLKNGLSPLLSVYPKVLSCSSMSLPPILWVGKPPLTGKSQSWIWAKLWLQTKRLEPCNTSTCRAQLWWKSFYREGLQTEDFEASIAESAYNSLRNQDNCYLPRQCSLAFFTTERLNGEHYTWKLRPTDGNPGRNLNAGQYVIVQFWHWLHHFLFAK